MMACKADLSYPECHRTKTRASLASLKSHDNYTFEHSVDVTFYGRCLAAAWALDRAYLKDLALGCLLHDIGKMYIDERILRTQNERFDLRRINLLVELAAVADVCSALSSERP
jgi:HD-GYP domain-containing protein (c-di-GMP phosphodiesterase class II)